jgi:phage gp36-like protein
MTYAVQQDLIDRFGDAELKQVADRNADGVIDAAVVNAALADADLVIDGYVGKRYDLPLASAPALLKTLACDIARHRLHKDAPPEVVAKNYDVALRQLRDIADGRLALDVAGSEPARDGATVRKSGPDRAFTSETLQEL